MDNRREFFRVQTEYRPLEGTLAIETINNQPFHGTPAFVLITDISAGGARVLTNHWFPDSANVVMRFTTEIDGCPFDFEGEIVRSKQIHDGVYEFGLEFTHLDDVEQKQVVSALNRMAIAMRKVGVRLRETKFVERPELLRLFESVRNELSASN